MTKSTLTELAGGGNSQAYFELPLESEGAHFFARLPGGQLALLKEFLETSYKNARACIVPDRQPMEPPVRPT